MSKITFPDNVIISNVSITHEVPTFYTESLSLKGRSRNRGIHRITGTFDIHIGDFTSQQSWTAFLLKLQGRTNTFELDLPLHFKSTEMYQNPTLTAAAGIGYHDLLVSDVGEIVTGSCFNMMNDNKTYYVTDVDYAQDQITIFPKLNQSHLLGSTIQFIEPVVTCRLSDDNQTITYSESGRVITQTINFIEAI
jgi:hypothetical protein